MRHVVDQARKARRPDRAAADLLVIPVPGKICWLAVHLASRVQQNRIWHLIALYPRKMLSSLNLFGHAPENRKGFFEQANGDSVLLDEDIGEMSPRACRLKLLRFLNDGTFRRVGEDRGCMWTCASSVPPEKRWNWWGYSADLYYRLNVLTLNIHRCAIVRRTSCRAGTV